MKQVLVWLLGFSLLAGMACSRRHSTAPLSPEEALQSFQVQGGFRVELFAAEPLVVDPVEIAFDENGLAYVAEMIDYPEDPPQGKPARGRIRVLEDTDGDGRADRSDVFADRLLQVTSVLPWEGGLLVTAAPDILYMKDTDGDRRADVREVVFTGFAMVNPEGRITNLRFSPDNWIYASNNGQRGSIRYTRDPKAPPVSVLGADFRFRLDRGLFEPESGPTQFGQALDRFGHRFITQNTEHVRNVVLPRRYLSRSPLLAAGSPSLNVSDHGQPSGRIYPLTKPQHWREVRTRMRQERYRENKLEQVRPLNPSTEIAGGYFTGAAGGTIYLGEVFPEEYRGNLFTGDVSANMVHRDILREEGVSFIASRAREEQESEFLTSTDPWFRPCNFYTGPDGCLYIVDIYREFIETPESVPEELKKDMDFYRGDTMGRIYRLVPKNLPGTNNPKPKLGSAGAEELARLLSHPNGWWRLTAQRLLLERQDRTVVPTLRKMARAEESAEARLHALYTLEGLDALDAADVEAAMKDPVYGVREHAIRLAESFPALAEWVVGLTDDPSPHVQLQAALSLGDVLVSGENAGTRKKAMSALARLAASNAEDRWFRVALLSSVSGHSTEMLSTLASETDFFQIDQTEGKDGFVQGLAQAAGSAENLPQIAGVLRFAGERRKKALSTEACQVSILEGLARGLQLAGASRLELPGAEKLIGFALQSPAERLQAAGRKVARHFHLERFLRVAAREALDTGIPGARRELAVYSLGGGDFASVRPVFEKLLAAPLEPKLFSASLKALGTFDNREVGTMLIDRWKSFGPGVRGDVLDVLLSHRDRVPLLLDAVEGGAVERAALDLPRKEKLLRNPDEEISSRARRVFHEEPSDRSAVVERFRPALEEPGDPLAGKVGFEKNCAICHLAREGRRVGPDLSGVSSRSKAQLLEDILHPSRSIQPAYTNYVVVTRDGRIHDGLIASETPGTLTLRRSGSEDETILRAHISVIRASSVSLMPDGFEASIGQKEMADLIAYLQGANLARVTQDK